MFRQARDTLKVIVQKPAEKPVVLRDVKAQTFTVGRSMECSYTLDARGVGEKHKLFVRRNGRAFLLVPDGVDCELASRDAKERIHLASLMGLGLVDQIGGHRAVPFASGCAALLRFGDTTLGVEYVSSHAPVKTEQLPPDLRHPKRSKNDWIYLSLLVAMILFSFGSARLLNQMEVKMKEEPIAVDLRYAKLILETPVVPQKSFLEQVNEEPEETKEVAEKEEVKPSKDETPKKKDVAPNAGAPKESALAYLKGGGGGGARGILQSRELSNVLSGVGVLTTKRPSGQTARGANFAYRESSGLDEMASGIARRSAGPGDGSGLGVGQKQTTSVANPFNVSGSGSQHQLRSYEEIDRTIRRYLEGVRFLYERYLRTNPDLQGRVTLRFTIDALGNVTDCKLVSSTMNLAAFHDELAKRVLLWKFPAIEKSSGSVSVVYPFTFLPKRN